MGRWKSRTRIAAAGLVLVAGMLAGRCLANPDALWQIVHGECVPAALEGRPPEPCAEIVLAGGIEAGYAALKDLRGIAQYLLIPTARVPGVEDPVLLDPATTNYFAAAWDIRHYVSDRLPRPLQRDEVGLAINAADARSQNQLHIHVDCIKPQVRDALREHAASIGPAWSEFPVPLAGRTYRAMRLHGADLVGPSPFRLVADGIPGARASMNLHGIAVIGTGTEEADPGFVVLARSSRPWLGIFAWAEDLLDHTCALAGAPDTPSDQPQGPVPRQPTTNAPEAPQAP